MTFELALSRMAAPLFGTSLPVWAAIISSVLGAMAAGYALGGRLSRSEDPGRWIAAMLIAAGILMAALSLAFPILLDFASDVRSHGSRPL